MYHSSFVDGRMDGEKKGVEEGIKEGRVEMVRIMERAGEPVGKIMQYTQLIREEVGTLS